MKQPIMIFLALALAAVSPAVGATLVDETRPASPDGTVSVELIAGRVGFVGWSRNEVRIRGKLGDDVERLEIDADDGDVDIEVRLRKGRNLRDAEATLEIHVPMGMEISVETVSAQITIEKVDGPLSISTISGAIEARGRIDEVVAKTVSGSVLLVNDVPLREGEFKTVSGKAVVKTALAPRGELEMKTVSGAVELHLPADTSARFDISTFSGRIDSAFGGDVQKSAHLPAKSLDFSMGEGRAEVTLSSISGSVELIKR